MTEGVSSYISLFADDAKLLKEIKKSQTLREVTEWLKHDIGMEQDIENGI